MYERLEEIGAHGAEARAGAILAGLSFEPDMQQRATKTFSGGWRMRIAVRTGSHHAGAAVSSLHMHPGRIFGACFAPPRCFPAALVPAARKHALKLVGLAGGSKDGLLCSRSC